ncbi:hypothetical protein K9N68_29865 [Kovacikia minuta CCNUW1]|nr:hypothetical protein [Kovacikia minuta]UBF25717.1 hypothetical protein K9N68_29865 [Kovacikia minuta CCNUW1]
MSSSSPFFITLIAGLMMAFAFQLLLTTLGVAVGITTLGFIWQGQSSEQPEQPDQLQPSQESEQAPASESGGSGKVAGQIGFAIGFGTLLTINTVLFLASFLAVKLSLVDNVAVGAILGVVLWSAYYLILIWLSTTAVSPLVGSVLGGVTASVRGLITTITRAMQDKRATPATPARSLTPLADPSPVLPLPFQPKTSATTNSSALAYRDLQKAVEAPEAVKDPQAVENLEAVEAPDSGGVQTKLKGYLDSLQIPQLNLDTIRTDLEGLLNHSNLVSLANSDLASVVGKAFVGKADRAMLVSLLSDRTDFSQQDINQVVDLVEDVWQKVFGQTQHPQNPDTSRPAQTLTIVQMDVEDYLLNAYPWQLKRKATKPEFIQVIYDPDADPDQVRQQLEAVNRDYFVEVLGRRDDLKPAKVARIADQLEAARQSVLENLEKAITHQRQQFAPAEAENLWQSFKTYLADPDQKVTAPEIKRQLKKLVKQFEQETGEFGQALVPLEREAVVTLLQQRQNLTEKRIQRVADQVEKVWHKLLEVPTAVSNQATTAAKRSHDSIIHKVADLGDIHLSQEQPLWDKAEGRGQGKGGGGKGQGETEKGGRARKQMILF